MALGSVSLVLAEAGARAGAAPARWLRLPRIGPAADAGFGLMLGVAAAGDAWLALGLTGLFRPGLIVAAGVGLLAASRRGWSPRPVWAAAAASLAPAGRPGMAALGAGLLAFTPWLLIPEAEIDAELYHLGQPWQWLQVHRALLAHVPFAFHAPATADLAFTLPLVLGDDRLAKWLAWWTLLAGSAVWAAEALRRGRRHAAWTGPLLACSAGTVHWMAVTAKNDLPAAACFVAGALLWRRRAFGAGAVLLGLAVATKIVVGPLALIWAAAHPPPRGRWRRSAVAFGVPLLPWLAKSWLATGNPVHPFGWAIIPTLDWGPANATALADRASRLWLAGTDHPATLLPAWLGAMAREYLPELVALPLLVWRGIDRRGPLAAAAAMLAILGLGHFPRFMMPAGWLLSLLVAEGVLRLAPAGRAGPAAVALAACAFARAGTSAAPGGRPWTEAFAPRTAVLDRILTTRGVAMRALAARAPAHGAPPRVLTIGETATYRVPGRVLYGGVTGETPLVWSLVAASRDLPDLERKMRQLGASLLLYNFVSADWLAVRYRDFAFDARKARLWVEYTRRHLRPDVLPAACDYTNGGYVLYRALRHPLPAPPARVWFAPGLETMYAYVIYQEGVGRLDEALGDARRLQDLLPDVGHAWNVNGHLCTIRGDTRNGLRYLQEFGGEGMVDSYNVSEWGACAARLGQLGLASRTLGRAWSLYPQHRDTIQLHLALVWITGALDAVAHRRLSRAAGTLDLAEQALAEVSRRQGTAPRQGRLIADTTALLHGARGEYLIAAGRPDEAMAALRAAYFEAPESRLAAHWQDLARRLAGGSRGATRP